MNDTSVSLELSQGELTAVFRAMGCQPIRTLQEGLDRLSALRKINASLTGVTELEKLFAATLIGRLEQGISSVKQTLEKLERSEKMN